MNRRLFDKYLRRQTFPAVFEPALPPAGRFRHAVVIPVLDEEQTLPAALRSLPAADEVLVLLVVNNQSTTPPAKIAANLRLLAALRQRSLPLPAAVWARLFWLDAASPGRELPGGGVGMARKIGCDSILPFIASPVAAAESLLFMLDADTLVEPDYFAVVCAEMARRPQWAGATLEVAHQPAANPAEQRAIDAYEDYLAYYAAGLAWAGSPYAQIAIGSALVARVDSYIACGGMRPRAAGEDFYFAQALRKIGPLGRIAATRVHPSSRPSDRVPFGTGPRIRALAGGEALRFHHPRIFGLLKELYEALAGGDWQKAPVMPPPVAAFLEAEQFEKTWQTILKNTAPSPAARKAAFDCWFDGLKTLRLVHFCENNDRTLAPLAAEDAWNGLRKMGYQGPK
ncbi:glycosyltransferase [Victivallis sp. Marseille-Q1083]|uniref:glycosyltransferase n=1 Tax=Victivallis sp. Marseille-Q1083 TaxID=2717288 RepID=UPI00158A0BE6|nr:glycosyltransferase [Victivallis sp. Marseille-Q1083]